MFARQVDLLAEYSSAINAAEQQHKAQQEALNHGASDFAAPLASQHDNWFNISAGSTSHNTSSSTCSTNENPYKRKHPLQFEPEFFAVLDASLKEQNEEPSGITSSSKHSTSLPQRAGSPWPSRAFKKARRTTAADAQEPFIQLQQDAALPRPSQIPVPTATRTPASTKTSAVPGPSLRSESYSFCPLSKKIRTSPSPAPTPTPRTPHKNLSLKPSGYLQNSNGPSIIDLRENDLSLPSDCMDSLREVFEYQDDGTLLPILDRASAQPSPAKKVRLGKASLNSFLRFLSEEESDAEGDEDDSKMRQSRKTGSSDGIGDDRGPQQHEKQPIDSGKTHNQHCHKSFETGSQALTRYQGPKDLSPSGGLDVFHGCCWNSLGTVRIIPLNELQGNELVLYQRSVAVLIVANANNSNEDDGEQSTAMDPCGENDLLSIACIEELDDELDDGNMADDEECELPDDAPLIELEEKIMGMDLD
ncbi:hypothetical protein BGZ54_000798 [Gamsiella multidivaricata]|nr:hypothetical protein BGZ54_000798 [Gamsiella multidivaricata]